MEGIMSDINDEMKATANGAIKTAKERFGQEVDFSELGIIKLAIILERIYWGFSNRTQAEGEDGVIFNTAAIWGSYLGEYMRQKWGGTWIRKGSDTLLSIRNIEFSPINWVYQKITDHPEYSLENYLLETKSIIYTSVIYPQKPHSKPDNTYNPEKRTPGEQLNAPVIINKYLLFSLVGVGGILLVVLAFIIGYKITKAGGLPAYGVIASVTSTNTNIPAKKTSSAAIPTATPTQSPTVTLLPTYTPKPTITPRPSHTPNLTYTQITTLIPTFTQTPSQSPSRTPTEPRPTSTEPPPPSTRPPPTATEPPPTATEPPPTATEPPPIVIESCAIDPPSVPAGFNVTITFIVHFSAPGYGFEALNPHDYPGQNGCSGIDDNGDGIATCDGSSGQLPESTKINVTLRSSVGDCSASYSSR
jgi:hypothetical protein